MVQLQGKLDAFEAEGLQLVSITFDEQPPIQRFSQKKGIEFLLLSDPGSKTIDAYKMRYMGLKPDQMGYGVAHPGFFVIAQDGTIAAKLVKPGYIARHSAEELIETARAALQ